MYKRLGSGDQGTNRPGIPQGGHACSACGTTSLSPVAVPTRQRRIDAVGRRDSETNRQVTCRQVNQASLPSVSVTATDGIRIGNDEDSEGEGSGRMRIGKKRTRQDRDREGQGSLSVMAGLLCLGFRASSV